MRIVCCICVLHVAYAYCMLHAASPEGGDAVPALPDGEAVPWHSIAALSVVPAVASPRRALRLWQHIVRWRRRTLHRTLRRCNVPTIARCVLPSHRCTVNGLLYHSMFCAIIQCFALSFNVLLYHSMFYSIIQCCAASSPTARRVIASHRCLPQHRTGFGVRGKDRRERAAVHSAPHTAGSAHVRHRHGGRFVGHAAGGHPFACLRVERTREWGRGACGGACVFVRVCVSERATERAACESSAVLHVARCCNADFRVFRARYRLD